jgi:hypothetical protein
MNRPLFAAIPPVENRPLSELPTDLSALHAIAQAAVDVELFTIPLYMGTLYSIQGMHEINASRQTFYKGRRWPGASPSRAPVTPGERAFNVVFSVFIQEMLHLQLAANIAACTGITPSFTNGTLQDQRHGFTCYGPEQHVIPHVIDLRDTTTYPDVTVDVRALSREQLRLFLAIEEPEKQARERIAPGKVSKYFPAVPFAGWTPEKKEADLPLFGTIGYMYECLAAYMMITYEDGSTLWGHAFTSSAVQRELFNTPNAGHPMAEYAGFPTLVPTSDASLALRGAVDMIRAITDQGEGSTIGATIRVALAAHARVPVANEVEPTYQSSEKALHMDYPSYDASGKPAGSADATARAHNDRQDHYARFAALLPEVDKVLTWPMWHAERGPSPWKPEDLLSGPDTASPNIPSVEVVAGALNRLKQDDADGKVFRQLSQVAAGSIYGITSVLDNYWSDPSVGFPFPAMGGSGDRVAICWAVLGKGPDLRMGIDPPPEEAYYHACQGLDLSHPGANEMPHNATFHTCIGSNACKGQGGCGFVQKLSGGGSCGGSGGGGGGCNTSGGKSISAHLAAQGTCGAPQLYSAPADNACNGYGGCAVPISASQLYPKDGGMQLFDILSDAQTFPKVGVLPFHTGDSVYQTAWRAYVEVLASRKVAPPPQPAPDDLRLALPPST